MYLFISFIILLVIIASAYKDNITKSIYHGNWKELLKVPIILLSIVVIPIMLSQIVWKKQYFESAEEKMEFAERYNLKDLYNNSYKEYAEEHPENLSVQFAYLSYSLNKNKKVNCGFTRQMYKDTNLYAAKISNLFIDLKCNPERFSIDKLSTYKDTTSEINHLKGMYYHIEGNWEKALSHYKKALEINPNFQITYQQIIALLRNYEPILLDNFMLNTLSNPNVSRYIKNDYYFYHGHWGAYFYNLYFNGAFSTSWGVFIAAFLVSFIWLYYLRTMDIFNREKWSYIFIVFILGGVFTNLCLPIYDFARLKIGFDINGNALNDFLYSTIVIGGSEELVKFLPWFLFGYFTKRLKEPFDYILYASVAALGFAFVENLMYLENYGNITIRALITSVAHMFDAVIIAYAFIIVKFRMPKNSKYKYPVLIAGFLLAILAHGFYDFWLISESVSDYQIITMIFFIISLHIWFFFKNNAMNHSPYFSGNEIFNASKQKDVLYISVFSILMLQYLLLSKDFGAKSVDGFFIKEVVFSGIFLVYFNQQINQFKVTKNAWNKLTLSKVLPMKSLKRIFNALAERGYQIRFGESLHDYTNTFNSSTQDLKGLKLRFFAPKTNPYIGDKLPVTGYCARNISVNEDLDWYLVTLDQPIYYSRFLPNQIIVRHKYESESLLKDKVEIYFMFIPDTSILKKDNIKLQELRYAGRAYARHLNGRDF